MHLRRYLTVVSAGMGLAALSSVSAVAATGGRLYEQADLSVASRFEALKADLGIGAAAST